MGRALVAVGLGLVPRGLARLVAGPVFVLSRPMGVPLGQVQGPADSVLVSTGFAIGPTDSALVSSSLSLVSGP